MVRVRLRLRLGLRRRVGLGFGRVAQANQHVALVVLLQRAVLELVVPLDAYPQRRRQPLVLRVPG